MRQVFRARPWVLPPEPAKLAELFRDGHVVTLDAGATFRHGGTEGYVALLLEGLVTFSFLDIRDNYHTFALVLPGRTIGDLDALNPEPYQCHCRVYSAESRAIDSQLPVPTWVKGFHGTYGNVRGHVHPQGGIHRRRCVCQFHS